MTRKYVELKIYQHEKESITIDSYQADSWEDFLFVRLPFHSMDQEFFHQISSMFSEHAKKTNKMVVLIPDHINIDVYGVEVLDEQPTG